VIRVQNQQTVYQHLRAAGVEVVLHYTPPVSRHPVYSGKLIGSDQLAITDQIAAELICLPVSPEITDEDISWTLNAIRTAL